MQAPSPKQKPVATGVQTMVSEARKRLASLYQERYSYWNHWRELSDYLLPRRGRYLYTPNQTTKGDKKNQKIIDPTGTLALRVLSSGMMSGMTSPARQWFRLGMAGTNSPTSGPLHQWLDDVTKIILRVFARSNFYNMIHVLYEELGAYGTGVMLILDDFDTVVRFETLTAGEYYLAVNEKNEVDTLYREFVMTVKQLVDQFGLENCSVSVQQLWQTNMLDKEVDVVHVIQPNKDCVEGCYGPKGMRWMSMYFERGATAAQQNADVYGVLRLSGYHEKPFIAPRWHVVSNDAYGRSPGMDALPDVRALQVMAKRKAQAIDKMVNPPMVASASMKNDPASVLPGGVTYVPNQGDASHGFRPAYQVNPNVNQLIEDIRETQDRVRQAFFADLFLMISQMDGVQPRQNLEIIERKEEKMLMLGPVLERLHYEAFNPLIDRIFAMLLRVNMLPPAPAELQGQVIDPEFISTLAQAQKSVGTSGIERMLQFVGSIAGVVPSALDKLDVDATIDEYGDLLGIPTNVLHDDQETAAIRMEKMKQAQAAQAQQQMMAMTEGAKNMSQVDVGGGRNAVQQMLGTA